MDNSEVDELRDDGEGSRSLLEIKSRIQRYFLDERPVTAVLETNFIVVCSDTCTTHEQKSIRDIILPQVRRAFVNALGAGVSVQFAGATTHVRIQFNETSSTSNYFTTRDGRLDFVKAMVVKAVVDQLNTRWESDIRNSGYWFCGQPRVKLVSVEFLLSNPIEYTSGLRVGKFESASA